MAAYRLAGPSGPAECGCRIAPVTTTGASADTVRSRKNAVSSMVSVPWVTTTPTAPEAISSRTRADNATRSPNPSDGLGSDRSDSVVIFTSSSASPGTDATRSSAPSAGTIPPLALGAMAMVPPMEITAT